MTIPHANPEGLTAYVTEIKKQRDDALELVAQLKAAMANNKFTDKVRSDHYEKRVADLTAQLQIANGASNDLVVKTIDRAASVAFTSKANVVTPVDPAGSPSTFE